MSTFHPNICAPRRGAVAEQLRQQRHELAEEMAQEIMAAVGKPWSAENVRGGSRAAADLFLRAITTYAMRQAGLSTPDIARAVNGSEKAHAGVVDRVQRVERMNPMDRVPLGLDPAIRTVKQAIAKANEVAALVQARHHAQLQDQRLRGVGYD